MEVRGADRCSSAGQIVMYFPECSFVGSEGADRCSLAGENGFQETGHCLFPTEESRPKIQSGVGANGENEGKVEIFLEREEVSAGEWRDILVVKREQEKEKEKEKEASNRNVSRLRIKVIAFSGFSPLCVHKLLAKVAHWLHLKCFQTRD